MQKGLWRVEVFKVVYLGHDEVKPDRQIGTIKVNDEANDHYLYKVDKIDRRKPTIRHSDELVLTGPRIASISAENSLTIDVDLFWGAYKDSLYINHCPAVDSLEICYPLERRITSKDGRGEISVLYAIYKNATEASIEVKLLGGDNSTTGVYGVVTASTSKIETFEYSSMLFLKKPSDTIKVGRSSLFPLSRSIVAVPLKSEFILDIHLMTGDNHDLFMGSVEFEAERDGMRKKLVDGRNCIIQVKVTWKSA